VIRALHTLPGVDSGLVCADAEVGQGSSPNRIR
jgi:hypothetical protein